MGLFDRFTKPTKPAQPKIRMIDDPDQLSGIRSTAMVGAEHFEQATGLDFALFDQYFRDAKAEWDAQEEHHEPFPQVWLTSLGLYVGELMIHMADMRWAVVEDQYGTALCVFPKSSEDSRYVFSAPVDGLAKRWAGEAHSGPLEFVLTTLEQILGREVTLEELNDGARSLAASWAESVEHKVDLVFKAHMEDLRQQAEQLDMSQPVEQAHALGFAEHEDILAGVEKLGFPLEWDLVMADAPQTLGDGRQLWVVEFCRSDVPIQWDQLYAAGVHLAATTGGEYLGVGLRAPE